MGDNLYWMITITDRNQSQKFLSFYKTYGIEVVLSTLGKGRRVRNSKRFRT